MVLFRLAWVDTEYWAVFLVALTFEDRQDDQSSVR